VTAQLVDARSGTHRWSDSYDRDLGDVLDVQSQIATSIARALQLAMGADDMRPPRLLHSTEAYTLYLRGRSAYDGPGDIPEAQSDYEQALALDPGFLRAAEALAWMYAYAALTQEMESRIAWQHANDAAQRALRIDGDSAPAHAVLGLMHAEYEYDWDAADAEFSKALELSPRDPVTLDFAARLACHRGRYEEALRRIDASLAVDPLSPRAHRRKGFILYLAGDDHGAEREFRRSLEIFPTFDWDHSMLTWILVARGEFQAALKEIQAEPALGGKDQGPPLIYHGLGRKAESDMALARLISEFPNWPTGVAMIYAYRAQADQAFEWLGRAYTIRDPDLNQWIRSPFFASLRGDSRYKAVLRKMNLPD
jgi:tetratricopeptide (TPR) repeat protein